MRTVPSYQCSICNHRHRRGGVKFSEHYSSFMADRDRGKQNKKGYYSYSGLCYSKGRDAFRLNQSL